MVYTPIYSDDATIKARAPQAATGFTTVLESYERSVDDDINHALRAVLGELDKNGYRIILPLTGSFNIIDPQKKEVTVAMHDDIKQLANSAVIALFRWDFSENIDRKNMSLVDIEGELNRLYGSALSIPQDFTTEFLEADKVAWDDGSFIQLEDDSGVLLWDGEGSTPLVVVDP